MPKRPSGSESPDEHLRAIELGVRYLPPGRDIKRYTYLTYLAPVAPVPDIRTAAQHLHYVMVGHPDSVDFSREDLQALRSVNDWFAERGVFIQPSPEDYSGSIRTSEWATIATTSDLHVWVDLYFADGNLAQKGYGGGQDLRSAIVRARERWRQEQDGCPS